jgi:hypothetical protein
MTHWNYRIIKTDEGWGLYEIHYDPDPVARTINPMTGLYETIDEVRNDLHRMYQDSLKEPLDDFAQED